MKNKIIGLLLMIIHFQYNAQDLKQNPSIESNDEGKKNKLLKFMLIPFEYNAQYLKQNPSIESNDKSKEIKLMKLTIEPFQYNAQYLKQNQLLKKIDSLNEKVQELEQKINDADEAIARLANGVLYDEYNAERVEQAKGRFEKIYKEENKIKYKEIKNLLYKYDEYNKDVLSAIVIITEKNYNTAKREEDIEESMKILKNTSYYKDIIKQDREWEIPFLTNLIERTLKKLEKMKSPKGRLALIDSKPFSKCVITYSELLNRENKQ